jgi:curved DNA-binding protein CbpA
MIHDPYILFGLPSHEDLADDQVRLRYLQLIREFPPEQNPAQFAAIREAYEKIRTVHSRAKYRLFDAGAEETLDQIIEEVDRTMARPRPTLMQLFEAIETPKKL